MNVRVLYKRRRLFLSVLAALALPFAFITNVFLFLALATVFILLLMNSAQTTTEKILIAFCASVLFSGVTVFTLRPYDIITILSLCYVMFKNRFSVRIYKNIIPFLIVVIVICFINYSDDAFLEAVRYVISMLLLVVVLNIDRCTFDELGSQFAVIGITNIIFALSTFILFTSGTLTNYTSGVINTNLYLSNREVRLFGFFSDPNKFMTFSFAMLFLVEYYMTKSRTKSLLILIFLVSSVLSMSRTAILVIILYLACKILRKVQKISKAAFYISVILGIFTFLFFYISDSFDELINSAYSAMAQILNREWTVSLGTTIAEDNRFLIWQKAWEYIVEKPVGGYGWMSNTFLLPYPTHSTAIALLLDGGIIALVAFTVLFWPLFRLKCWELTIPLIYIPSLLLDLQNYRMWFLILGLVLASRGYRKANRIEV